MKKITYLVLLAMIFCGLSTVQKKQAEAAEIAIPVSATYSSHYWWRGGQLNDGFGVIWAGTGVEYGDFALSLAVGIDELWVAAESSANEDAAKAWTEVDLGASYTLSFDMVEVGFGVMYCGFPYYDEVDANADDASFIETSVSLGLNTILSPYVEAYYDYYLEESAAETPQEEDYYIKVGVSQDLISTEDGFTCALGAYVGYYNNAYLDVDGFSDTVVSLSTSKVVDSVSFDSALNYARTLDKDFSPNQKNHFWVDFGVTVTL